MKKNINCGGGCCTYPQYEPAKAKVKYKMTAIHILLRELYESSIKYMKMGNLLSLCNRQNLEEHQATILIEKNETGYTVYINLDNKDILTAYPPILYNFGGFIYHLPEDDKKRILNIISDYDAVYESAEKEQQNLIDMFAYTPFDNKHNNYKTQVISDLSEQMGITTSKLDRIIEYRRKCIFA